MSEAVFLDEISPNWRYDRMMASLKGAQEAFSQPLTPSERSDGWTDEIVNDIRDWIDRCATALTASRHPPTSIVGSWGRWLSDYPGRAFDPRVSDERASQLLEMDNAIHDVHEIERLYSQVHQLMNGLDDDIAEGDRATGWSDSVRLDVYESLRDLRNLLASGRKLDETDSEIWRDSLSSMSAQWKHGNGERWQPCDPLPRFWTDRPGPLWDALGRIDRLFNAVTSSDQFA